MIEPIALLHDSNARRHVGTVASFRRCFPALGLAKLQQLGSSALADHLLRHHLEGGGDLLDSYITQVIARFEWQQHFGMPIMAELEMLVLAGHNPVAVALQKTSHVPRTNWRQGEPFLLAHSRQVSLFACQTRTCTPRLAPKRERDYSPCSLGSAPVNVQ